MGWLYVKTALLICLVMPRVALSAPREKSVRLSSQYPSLFDDLQSAHTQLAATGRQSGGGGGGPGIGTIIDLAIKFLPVVMNLVSNLGGGGGGGGGSPAVAAAASPAANSVDRIETIDLKDEDETFSWQNMISVGLKLFLTLLSSSDGIDKSDSFPTQALLGTAISAITGSTDPTEVAKMAKQATEVIGLASTLFQALQTSFSA